MKENVISVVWVEYYYTVITEVMGGGGGGTYWEADLWGWAGAAVLGLSSSLALGGGLFFRDLFILSSNKLWSLSFSCKT